MLLGVNIDHIALLREARRVNDPDLLEALGIVYRAGGDQITIHLREDRRHIHDDDLARIVALSRLPVNVECALEPQVVEIVASHAPQRATLVPEKREEVTTEGGLDVDGQRSAIERTVARMRQVGTEVSLFIEPSLEAVRASAEAGASWVELHTGRYANICLMADGGLARTRYRIPDLELSRAALDEERLRELSRLAEATRYARNLGLRVAAGHGLNYHNVDLIVAIDGIEELNIGQSIVARSVYVGLEQAVIQMKALLG